LQFAPPQVAPSSACLSSLLIQLLLNMHCHIALLLAFHRQASSGEN
jgi:hypothetical protein